MGIMVGREFLRGAIGSNPVSNFAIDFVASEVRRITQPKEMINAVADAHERSLSEAVTGFSENLSKAALDAENIGKRAAIALSDRFLKRVRLKYSPAVEKALKPLMGETLADLTTFQLRKQLIKKMKT